MICQSATQQLQPGDVVVVEVGVGCGRARSGTARGQRRRRAPDSTRLRHRRGCWQDGRHGRRSYWQQVRAARPPRSRRPSARRPHRRADHDARLHRPGARDGTAYPALATWIERGVYDDLLAGLGDGMAAGLPSGSASAAPTRSSGAASALILAECSTATTTRTCCPAQGPRVGRPDRDLVPARARPPRLRARQGLGARRRPRRRRDRRAWPARRTSGQRADRAARRARRPAAAAGRPALQPPASPTGWRRPRWRCCAATWCRSSVLEPWMARLAADRRRPSAARRPRPLPRHRQRRRPSCARSTSSSRWPPTRPRSAPTCCWCWSTRCERPTRRTSGAAPPAEST